MKHRKGLAFTVIGLSMAAGLIIGLRPARLGRRWEIDEPIRLAETRYWDLFRSGDFSNSWWRDPVEASHPVLMKFVYGAALEALGHRLPGDFAFIDYASRGGQPTNIPTDLTTAFEPLKIPGRILSVVAGVVGLGLLVWLAFDLGGPIAAAMAAVILLDHFVWRETVTTIISDPLESLMILASGLACWFWWRRSPNSRFSSLYGVAAGIAAAFAFLTRLNGILAIGGIASILIARRYLESESKYLQFATAALAAFLVCWAALSPSYWLSGSHSRSAVTITPAAFVSGFRAQVSSLQGQLRSTPEEWKLESFSERFMFAAGTLSSGKSGKLIFGGFLALLMPAVRRSVSRSNLTFALAWAAPVTLIFFAWLPLAWHRYVDQVLPEVALLSALGWAGLARLLRSLIGTDAVNVAEIHVRN